MYWGPCGDLVTGLMMILSVLTDDFICFGGVNSMTSFWSSEGLGRLHVLSLGRHSVTSCALETISESVDMGSSGTRSHQLMPAKLQESSSPIRRETAGISADLTQAQLSLSVLIVSAAGAVV